MFKKVPFSLHTFALIVFDILILLAAFALCTALYYSAQINLISDPWAFFQERGVVFNVGIPWIQVTPLFLILWVSIYLFMFFLFDFYHENRNYLERRQLLLMPLAVLLGSFAVILASFTFQQTFWPRKIILLYNVLVLAGLFISRVLLTLIKQTGSTRKKALILGCNQSGLAVYKLLSGKETSSIRVTGFIESGPAESCSELDVPVIPLDADLTEIAKRHNAGILIIAVQRKDYDHLIQDFIQCSHEGIAIKDAATIYEEVAHKIPLTYIDDYWLLFTYLNQSKVYFHKIKRASDVVLSAILLILFSPLLALCALAVKLTSPGPILYRQTRVGLNGKLFQMVKFRSMVQDAEKASGAVFASERDSRITYVGRILRKMRFDELPQLWLVFFGEMSLIGPRPERPEFVKSFLGDTDDLEAVIPFYKERHSVKPGITGWAQVMYPYGSSKEDTMEKLRYDLYYVKYMGPLLDLVIIIKTVKIILFGKGR